MNLQSIRRHANLMIKEGDIALASVLVDGLMKQIPRSRYEVVSSSPSCALGIYSSGRIYVADPRPHVQLAILNIRLNRPITSLGLLAEAEDMIRFSVTSKLRNFINRKCGFPHMNYNIEFFGAHLGLLRDFEKCDRSTFARRLVSHGLVCTEADLAGWEAGLSLPSEKNLTVLAKLPIKSSYPNLTEFRSMLSLMLKYRKLEPSCE